MLKLLPYQLKPLSANLRIFFYFLVHFLFKAESRVFKSLIFSPREHSQMTSRIDEGGVQICVTSLLTTSEWLLIKVTQLKPLPR